MQMHVVSAVVMHGCAALGAFQEVAGLGSDPAGGVVAGGVVQLQPVEADFVQGPGGERPEALRGHSGAAGCREHPVGRAGYAVVEVQSA